MQHDSQLSRTSPAELQSAEVRSKRESTALPSNRQEMGNLTESALKHKLGNKSSCCSQNQSMIKGRDFHLMVSSGLSQGSQTRTHSGGEIVWPEPAAAAVPQA